jgi:hypothetical protein
MRATVSTTIQRSKSTNSSAACSPQRDVQADFTADSSPTKLLSTAVPHNAGCSIGKILERTETPT